MTSVTTSREVEMRRMKLKACQATKTGTISKMSQLAFSTVPPIPRTYYAKSTSSNRRRVITACITPGPVIALTREAGKNGKLAKAVQREFDEMTTLELPCVATVEYETGIADLCGALLDGSADWVVVSSPESARIFLKSWIEANRPTPPSVAAIGKGTGEVLRGAGIHVAFEPSKATFAVLAGELPFSSDSKLVLYPVSAKASTDNVAALEQRGFIVNRINTYTTETALWTPTQQEQGRKVTVATFASPTTVRGWVENVGMDTSLQIACIGTTSAKAARKAGFTNIHYPTSPGIEGWIDAIRDAIKVKSMAH